MSKENLTVKKATKKESNETVLNIPTSYEEQLLFFKEKQKLVKKLEALNKTVEELNDRKEFLKDEILKDDFVTQSYTLVLTKNQNSYREEDVTKINNPVLITEFINFISDKIQVKINDLKTELTK